jgi:ABC-type phosphate/phosphonate transport system substrate-binding protein
LNVAPPILVGAVIYDPKVAVIWDIIKEFFAAEGCPIDYVFYSNYELQVQALLAGHIQIAWNSPLAWVDAQRRASGACRAIAMRDTDRDRVSHLVVRTDAHLKSLNDLKSKTVATGAEDSPQATLLPLQLLRQNRLEAGRDFQVRRFDVLVGKHGDHIGGEEEALRCLGRGDADAACILDLNWERWSADGTIDPRRFSVLATTPAFDHCNFTVLDRFPRPEEERWKQTLFRMRYENEAHREMMDLEGLKAWLPGRTSGYELLTEAVRDQRFFERAGAPAWSEAG